MGNASPSGRLEGRERDLKDRSKAMAGDGRPTGRQRRRPLQVPSLRVLPVFRPSPDPLPTLATIGPFGVAKHEGCGALVGYSGVDHLGHINRVVSAGH